MNKPKRPRRWRRELLVVGLIVLLLAGGYVALHVNARLSSGREVRQAVAELDQADPGWRFDDVQAQRRKVSEEENSARQVREVIRLMSDPTSPPGKRPAVRKVLLDGRPAFDVLKERQPQEQLNEEEVRKLRAEFQDMGPALEEARKLAKVPYGRHDVTYNVDYLSTILDDIQNVRDVADLLVFDAALRAQDADMEGTCTSLRAATNAGRSVGDEPCLIASLVRIACVHLALDGLERALAQGEPDGAALAEFQRLLEWEEEETQPALETAVRGERALFHRMLEAYESGQVTFEEVFGERKKTNPTAWDWFTSVNVVPVLRRSQAVYLRMTTEQIEAVRAPLPEWGEQMAALKAKPIDKTAVLARLLLPATWKVMEAVQRKQARLHCTMVGLAAERFRQAKGRWPDRLGELVPDFLAAVPDDPYDGEPLRLRRLDDGLVIYSLGPDGQDDGGNIDRAFPTAPGTDLGFRLWDVAQRRQPPPPKPAGPDPEDR